MFAAVEIVWWPFGGAGHVACDAIYSSSTCVLAVMSVHLRSSDPFLDRVYPLSHFSM